MTPIPKAIADRAIQGRNLMGATLGAHLGAQTTLLVFLRHLA
jgi:hypothetical protein